MPILSPHQVRYNLPSIVDVKGAIGLSRNNILIMTVVVPNQHSYTMIFIEGKNVTKAFADIMRSTLN